MVEPKVFICCPVAGQKQYSANLWLEWIANQDYKNYDFGVCVNGNGADELEKQYNEVEITDKHGQIKKPIVLNLKNSEKLSVIQKITYAREKLRRYAVEKDYDYIFFLDSDTIPSNKDAILQLMKWNVDCISGLYFYKNSRQPVVIDKETNTNISIDKCEKTVWENKIIEVWGFGFGVLLLSKNAYKNPFDYDLFGEERSDDFGYCHVLEQAGIKRWFNPFVLCKHFSDEFKLPNGVKFQIPVKNEEI